VRTHARFGQYAPSIDAQRFLRIVSAENLVAGRLETGYSVRIDDYALLDLTFASDGEVAWIPFVVVQGVMLFMRQASPLVWPRWLPNLSAGVLQAIEDLVEPWLRSLAVGRFVGGEIVRYFGHDAPARARFERARAAGFLGAAPIDDVLDGIAPYVYALRFSHEARVAVGDPRGANGAAMLARVARVDADLGDASMMEDATAWFGLDVFRRLGSGPYDVAVGERQRIPEASTIVAVDGVREGERAVPVARPVPVSIMVSFDLDDGAKTREFSVRAPVVKVRADTLPAMRVVGGSSGRIGIVLRDDYAGTPDADSDAATALAQRLNEQGFAATLVGASHVRAPDFDLLHVFGTECAKALRASFERCDPGRVPIVLSAYLDDPKDEAAWGSAVHREAISNSIDEVVRAQYARAVGNRQLVAPHAPAIGASISGEAEVHALIAAARAAIVASPDEERRLRERGFAGTTRIAPALLENHAEPSPAIAELAGGREFVLVHAPMDPRCNQYLVAQACAALGYPLVLLGTVTNTEYYTEVLARLGDGGCWLPAKTLSPADLSGLYRRARVFADVSWNARGLYRLARAAAGGSALVASAAGYARGVWPGLAQIADPASGESVAGGIKAAWERAGELGPATAQRTAEQYAPFPMLVATLAAYQHAATV